MGPPRQKSKTLGLAVLVLGCFAIPASVFSQSVPPLINYQGRLTDQTGASLPAGAYSLQFRIWDSPTAATASDLIWGQQQNVTVQSTGVFGVMLGTSGGSPIPGTTPAVTNLAYAFAGSNCFLGVTVVSSNGSLISSPSEILPRQQILSVPFALNAGTAGVAASVLPGSITSASIANGAVGSSQLAVGSVGLSQLAPGIVGSQVFSNTGSFIVPTNVGIVYITLFGGGGGGGAGDQIIGGDNYGGGGGGAGGVVLNYPVPVTPGGSYTVTLGAGGAGAPSGQTGGSPSWSGYGGSTGGSTAFGGLISAYGGAGGAGGTGVNQGGGGGGGGGGSTSADAGMGFTGNAGSGTGGDNSYVGGAGGNSPFGSGGSGANGQNANGGNATGYGAGGGGGAPSSNGNGKGGTGSAGFAIIRY